MRLQGENNQTQISNLKGKGQSPHTWLCDESTPAVGEMSAQSHLTQRNFKTTLRILSPALALKITLQHTFTKGSWSGLAQ